jgi:hypothetical protein
MIDSIDFEALGDSMADLAKSLKNALDRISEKDTYFSFNKRISEIISASFEKLPTSVVEFSKSGWFLTKDMTFAEIHEMAELVENNEVAKVDLFMTRHIQENRNRIFKTLLERFPSRNNILKSGISAHEKQDYFASIPLFLSQSDGLCYQITGYKLFTTEKKRPKVAKYHDTLKEGTFDHVLLNALTVSSSLNAHETDMIEFKGSLNRHEVLHGISLDYGSEVNSCKSISLLNFIGEILWKCEFEQNKKRTTEDHDINKKYAT